MAVSTGTATKRFVSAVSYWDQRQIENRVVDIQREFDLLDIFQGADRYEPTSVGDYHHFVNSALFTVGDTTGATIVGSGSATTLTGVKLTAATSGFAMIGTLCLLPNGKVGRVSAISTASSEDTLTIKSVDDTNLTLVAGNKISFFSNAQEEESSAPNSNRYDVTKYFNKLQIFRKADVVTDIQKVSKLETSDSYMYMSHIQKVAALRGEIAAAFIAGKMSVTSWSDSAGNLTGANGNPVQTTRGLDDYVATYGITDTLTTPGTVVAADLKDLVTQMAAQRCPTDYMVWLNTGSYAIYSDFLKGLNSSGVYSGRLQLDGKTLDLNVDGWKYAGFDFSFMKLPILDHKELFNFTGSAGIQKNAYFVPKGNVDTVSGGTLPRIRARYFSENPMDGGKGDIIKETHQGMLAPTPVGRQANFTCDWYTIQGLEILGAQHFIKQAVQA